MARQTSTSTSSPGKRLLRYLVQHHVDLPGGYLSKALQLLAQGLMDAEVSQQIAASRYQRHPARRAYRNGYRASQWRTRFSTLMLRVPKLRQGTYSPSFLDHPNVDFLLAQLAAEAFLVEPDLADVQATADHLGITLNTPQAAVLHAALYDLAQVCKREVRADAPVSFDQFPIQLHGRERDLALAIHETQSGKREIVAYEITREADHLFWQDFIRRLGPTATSPVQYINNSNVHHVLRLTENDTPKMALAA